MSFNVPGPRSGDVPPASLPATLLVLSPAQKKRVMRFTGVAVVLIMVSAVAGGVYLQRSLSRHVDFRYSILVMIFVVGVPAVVLTAGVRRFNARRLRNRGIPARLDFTAEDMTVQSAAGALTLPWARTPVLYLQAQGAASCSMPAFDPDKRQVLFVDVPAERLRDVIMSHSGGRTVPRVVQAGQAAYGLRNLAQGAATVSRGRR